MNQHDYPSDIIRAAQQDLMGISKGQLKRMRKAARMLVLADLQRRAITGGASPFKRIGVGAGGAA